MTHTNVILENHEQRIKELESHDANTMSRVADILEKQLPEIKTSIASLSVKITNMSVLNVGAIIGGIIINKILK